ncbi:MAG: hypothetical protein ACKO4Z_06515 [Planctomycetota bacterium]
MTRSLRHLGLLAIVASMQIGASGCGRQVPMTPVEGRVTLDGKPLQLGAVMVQPKAGPAAQAKINPDGTFRLGTFKPDDGAIVGPATVRVICRKDITPPGGERAYGPSLIPEKYSRFETSGIAVEIKPGMPALDISLTTK